MNLSNRLQIIGDTYGYLVKRVGKRKSRSVIMTGAACLGNLIVGTGKLSMGIMSLSFFTCASGLYTFLMVAAKACALKGLVKEKTLEEQYLHYQLSGMIVMAASVLYVIYSTRLLRHPETGSYDIYTGLGIATFAFAELGLNIRGVIVERHNRTLLFHAIRMINLASSLICLVLTQTAILSFTHDSAPDYDPSVTNGWMGILMGTAATLIGCAMLGRVRKIKRKQETEEDNGTYSGG